MDHAFIEQHTAGYAEVRDALLRIPVEQWADAADVPLEQIEQCVDMIVAAKAMTVRVELGIQQGVNSTLNSYLEKLLIMLTGSFGRKGTNQLHSWLVPLWGNSPNQRFAAADIEVIGGLLPPNLFPDAVLSDHPDRLRAVWIDSSNPANTASNTARVEQALRALDLVVVVDVAMTETARLAHYVLPASSQYEKTEFTLFNFEFPKNYFHVRAGVLAPLEGTLPEPEIYTRLSRALGLLPGDNALAPLRDAAFRSRPPSPRSCAPSWAPIRSWRRSARSCSTTRWAPPCPTARPPPRRCGRPRISAQSARRRPCAARSMRAVMFRTRCSAKRCSTPSSDRATAHAFTEHDYDEVWSLVSHPDRKVHLAIAPMLEWLGRLDPANAAPRGDYPFVLAAGQRRMFNANQIFRDPAWRRDDPDGALLISAADLAALGAEDGEWIAVQSAAGRVVARCKRDDSMRSGQLALPHGYGQDYPAADGERLNNGPRVNVLTDERQPRSHRRHALPQARPGAAGAAGRSGSRRL